MAAPSTADKGEGSALTWSARAVAGPKLPDGVPPEPDGGMPLRNIGSEVQAPQSTRLVSPPASGQPPTTVMAWFDSAGVAAMPDHDETLASARSSADAYARRAKAANTRRAYMAGVRAWCAWCDQHARPCLPASGADVAAFLATEARRGRSVATIGLRRAAIRYLHVLAGCPVPTGDAQVSETMAGIGREAAEADRLPAKKLPVRIAVLRQMLDAMGDDLPALRDRALLLVGFAGALRRSELAAMRVEHLEDCGKGLMLALPRSKGDREGRGVLVPLPFGATELCPVRALRRWMAAAGITAGPVFRRMWRRSARTRDAEPRQDGPARSGPLREFAVGAQGIEPRTVARIVQGRAAAAGFDRRRMGGHSLKRGALTTGMDSNVHPTRLKRLGRHKSYDVLDGYLELGEPFDSHALHGLL